MISTPPFGAAWPHSRACGIRQHHHGPECHANCPTCGGVGVAPSPVQSGADATPSMPPPAATTPGDQVGPGWIMTTHGPVRRARPPWDIPAGPDYPGATDDTPAGTVEALDAAIARIEGVLDGLRRLRVSVAGSTRR